MARFLTIRSTNGYLSAVTYEDERGRFTKEDRPSVLYEYRLPPDMEDWSLHDLEAWYISRYTDGTLPASNLGVAQAPNPVEE